MVRSSAPDNVESVPAADLADVDYISGNAITAEAQIQIPVAFNSLGEPTSYVDYHIQNFLSQFAQPSVISGDPTPADVVYAASAFAAAYTGVANTEDCWNIANEVAAAAGASMGWSTYSTDPEDNQASGFWRISQKRKPKTAPLLVREIFQLKSAGIVLDDYSLRRVYEIDGELRSSSSSSRQ